MINESILITGANAGLGKETARQLALKDQTKRIILGCRNPQKAEIAKKELEVSTGKKIFEILLMDVSEPASVKKAVKELGGTVDALIMNAGGMGRPAPEKLTPSGMNQISATNLLGHVALVDEMIKLGKINNVIMLASSEAARGIKNGNKRPALQTNSPEELASILNGSYFGDKFKPMDAYAHVKYVGTLWLSSMARKHPSVKFISVSPGSTSGTASADSAPVLVRFMYKYILIPIVMPLLGMVHKLDQGAARFVDAISNEKYQTGGFYASVESKIVGKVVDQFTFFPDMANETFQDNALTAINKFYKT